ncbi:MAG: hypothetical protein WC850_01525 [Candidatus Gracilibacteria bacterium]
MRDLTKINYIKTIDKDKWLKDRKEFKIVLNNFFKDKILQKELIQTGYESTRGNLSNYVYQKYYLDLYKQNLGVNIFIILINGSIDKKSKELKTNKIYEYLSMFEYFKRVFNLIFNLLDDFEILHNEINKIDRRIFEQLTIGVKLEKNDIAKLRINFTNYINTITKICENLDILLCLLEILKGKKEIQINKRNAFLYFNKLFGGEKESNNYFENIYIMRNYFLHKESPDFSFFKIKMNSGLLIYENHFQIVIGNFTFKAYQMIKGLIDFYFEKYNEELKRINFTKIY